MKWGKVLEKQEGPGCSQKLPGPMLIAFTEFSNGLILFFFTFPQLPPIPIQPPSAHLFAYSIKRLSAYWLTKCWLIAFYSFSMCWIRW